MPSSKRSAGIILCQRMGIMGKASLNPVGIAQRYGKNVSPGLVTRRTHYIPTYLHSSQCWTI